MLKTYEEFAAYVDRTGFMTLSANPLGLPSVGELTEESAWWTGREDDPWQWRVRIVEERRAAYAKIFHRQPSFVSPEWYPAVLAARRGRASFEDAYEMGLMTLEAKRIHELFFCRNVLAAHEIKRLGGFTGKSKGRFDGALTALQAGMYLTVSGMTRMTTLDGRAHSWPVTEYMRVETWAWEGVPEKAAKLGQREAHDALEAKILEVLPGADKSKIARFITA